MYEFNLIYTREDRTAHYPEQNDPFGCFRKYVSGKRAFSGVIRLP